METIFLYWREKTTVGQKIGTGPVRRARWAEDSPAERKNAKEYIASDLPGGWMEVEEE